MGSEHLGSIDLCPVDREAQIPRQMMQKAQFVLQWEEVRAVVVARRIPGVKIAGWQDIRGQGCRFGQLGPHWFPLVFLIISWPAVSCNP